MSAVMDRIRRDLKDDPYYQQNYANDGERFLAWYLRHIYLRTPIQARKDITDGADDKQIDAVIIDDDRRRVVVVQGKFYSAGKVDHEPLQEILSAWCQIQNLAALQENANAKLRVKLDEIAAAIEEDYEVDFELVTVGELTPSAKADLEAFQETIANFEHPTCSITLVDEPLIAAKLAEAEAKDLPVLEHTIRLEAGRYLDLDVANFKSVVAAVPLTECLKLPGIKDGTLFRKNVRQSLGLTNKVNKGLRQTLSSENPQFFFFFHNGITALCDKLSMNPEQHTLSLKGLSVVNGCQSLTTILSCSEKVKAAKGSYVLFRFYEIPQRDVADRISVFTNSQSAVKARDLRSNDKRVLSLKKAYEAQYRDGYFITKRGEERPADRDAEKTVEVGQLSKCLVAWQCQRPNIAFNETKLFDKHFEQLFRPEFAPADILALVRWQQQIDKRWNGNLGLVEDLLAVPSYAKFHLLMAIQACFAIASNQSDKVPSPSATVDALAESEPIISMAANCFNSALDTAMNEYSEKSKVFSVHNWLKSKDSVLKIQASVRMYLGMLPNMPGGKELKQKLVVAPEKFGLRWVAE